VACCHACNNTSRHLMRLLAKSDNQWQKYLFY